MLWGHTAQLVKVLTERGVFVLLVDGDREAAECTQVRGHPRLAMPPRTSDANEDRMADSGADSERR